MLCISINKSLKLIFFPKIHFIFIMPMSALGYIFMCADMCRSLKSLQALHFPETGVTGVCELPETGAQN